MKFKSLIVLQPLFIWILLIPIQLLASHTFDDFDKYLIEGVTQTSPTDSVSPPWDKINLSDVSMKPGYPFVVKSSNFPWVPVIGSVVAVGTVTYFLTKEDDEDPEPCSFTISAPTVSSTCGLANGSAMILTNPPANYTYAWSNGATTSSINEVSSGTYSVTVTLSGTTCSETLSVPITNNNPIFDASVSTTDADCGQDNGSAIVAVTPPGTYTYQWSNGSTEQNQTTLTSGQYSLTVSAGGQCVNSYPVQIGEATFDPSINITTTSSGCGQSDGTATVTVDPPGEYTYAWSNGQGGSEATGLSAGEYTVSVSLNGTSCIQTTTFTVDELPAGHTVSVTTTPSGCGLTDGTATATVDPPGEYTYAWSNGQSGPEATGLGAAEYTVSVSVSGTSCMQTTTFTVDELPADILLTFTTTPAGCGVSDGTATVIADPPGAFTFLWSNGQTSSQITGVPSGMYSVTVTIMGTICSKIATVEVEQTGGGFTASFSTVHADCGIANGSAVIDVTPAGEYTYQWSNAQTGSMLQQVSAGTYTVTVSDQNACTEVFSIAVAENPPAFISIGNITPGTCQGGGEIIFTLTTPGTGPLDVEVLGPKGTFFISLILTPGTYALSTFQILGSGTHTFFVFDQQAGDSCKQIASVGIPDISPPLLANDDFYETQAGVPIDANALDNDSGLSIEMISVSDEFGGSVTFLPTGDFDFIPEPGFSGDASFVYTVTDACGTTTTALVIIIVAESVCDFTTEFTLIPASCGLDDGAIAVEVNEPGSYAYVWSNGDSGPSINSLFAGMYSVTIADLNLGCDLEFTVDLVENPAEHIDDIIITQPACGVEGEIQFTVTSDSQNPLVMSIDHPNGTSLFFIDAGVILLSDFISITAGDYTIDIFDAGAGADCTESLEVTLTTSPSLEIFAEAVIPPSEPTAMDGLAIIVVTMPGTLPYEILLNGNSWGVAIDNTFQVGGLEVGEYTIQIIDAEGCVSNVLMIIVPFPGIIFSFGTSVLQTTPDVSNDVPETLSPSTLWRQTLTASVKYSIGSVYQEVMARYAAPVYPYDGFVELSYMIDLIRYSPGGVGITMQGGAGGHFENDDDLKLTERTLPTYLLLKASVGYTVLRRLRLQGSMELRVWEKFEKPRIELGVSIPFVRSDFRWVK